MVKPDLKHNYYSDLELPTTASVDDVRKAYRKLALQYHPDRNSGREDECIPKFQAIQAANEVLSDPTTKQKYDTDRRKVGLYPATGGFSQPRQPTPGNPYAATSAYPPPPRRTQPGTWARPPPPGHTPSGPANANANANANGADRFSNFPRPSPTSKKDAAQDRANMFKAWQNMNTAQERQQRFNPQNQPPPQQPQASRPRPPPPPPPPRQDPKMPSEEQIRAGMRHKNGPAPFDESYDRHQTAWSAFNQQHAGKPGVQRSNTFKTPKKPGFNPNAPGSDERGAPGAGSHYVHRNKSADFGRPKSDMHAPPPSRGGPHASTTPVSPVSPTSHHQRTFSGRAPEDVPFTEGYTRPTRPYPNIFGEKTEFDGEGLRRSHSSQNTTKLGAEDAKNRGRARSTSPMRSSQDQHHSSSHQNAFDLGDNSSEGVDSDGKTPEEPNGASQAPHRPGTAPNAASPFARPKKVPTPPSRRANGAGGPTSPPPPMPGMPSYMNGGNDGAQSEGEQPSRSNMYEPPFFSPWPERSATNVFASYSTSSERRTSGSVPLWAIPSSINPSLRRNKKQNLKSKAIGGASYVTAADENFIRASIDERAAFCRLSTELHETFGNVPHNLDMEVFLKLALKARHGIPCGNPQLDRLLSKILLHFPTVGVVENDMADKESRSNSFNYQHGDHMAEPANARARSEENINTDFSGEPWTGEFMGEPSYFDSPGADSRKRPEPSRRGREKKATNPPRAATFDIPTPTSAPQTEVPQRPWGSAGTPSEFPRTAAADGSFNPEDWQKEFQDPSWTWPPPPPNPPSPGKTNAGVKKQTQGRRSSRASSKKATGAKHHPSVVNVDEDETVEVEGVDGKPENGAPIFDDGDLMDIDNTPPAQYRDPHTQDSARPYAQPISAWRQQQEQRHQRTTSGSSRRSQQTSAGEDSNLNANLDDLRHAEPLAPQTSAGDGFNFADMSSSLPFKSQSSAIDPAGPQMPRHLNLPAKPKAPAAPTSLSKVIWHNHASDFAAYLKAFHAWNSTMLGHFQSREQEVQSQMAGGMGWLEATGDTSGMMTGPTGYTMYQRGIAEDRRVREAWNLGWDKHTEAVEEFRKTRESVRRLVIEDRLKHQ